MKLPFSLSLFPKKDRYEKRMIHPVRDWLIGLTVAVACIFTAAGHSAYTFLIFEHVSISTYTADGSETVAYKKALVETVLGRYADRAATFASLMEQAPVIAPTSEAEVEVPQATTTEEIGIEESVLDTTATTTTPTTSQEVILQ